MSIDSKDTIKARINELKSIFEAKYPKQTLLGAREEQYKEYLQDQQYCHAKIHGLQEAYNLLKGTVNWKIKIAE